MSSRIIQLHKDPQLMPKSLEIATRKMYLYSYCLCIIGQQ